MKLTNEETRLILSGDYPRLEGSGGNCPFNVDEEIVLKTTKTMNGPIPEVLIRITERHVSRKGAWSVVYAVKDNRGLYVNAGLGYTRSPARALDSEAPILDPHVIERYVAEAEHKTALLGAEHSIAETKETLQHELAIAQERGRKGRVRKLEAQLEQHDRKCEPVAVLPPQTEA